MKIATYNIWNENKGGGARFRQIIEEIRSVQADVIGLQEVTPYFYEEYLLKSCGYPYGVFRQYTDEEEGLAIFSRYPLEDTFFFHTSDEYHNSAALNVIFQSEGTRYSVTNLHLPWNSARQKEDQITQIDRYLHEQLRSGRADVFILLGDFNGSLNSSVHRYLLGEQTLNGQEADPYWFELSSTYAAIHNLPLLPTLDFVHNPRWQGQNTTEIPYAADRIYAMYGRGNDTLENVALFGTAISPETGLAPSDHYGVAANITFRR